MKFLAECWTCREADEGGATTESRPKLLPAEIALDLTCTLACPKGHNERWGIANPHHEVLFDMGALAILDGYYREAITTFAAAVERFQEFYVRAACLFREINEAAVEAAWRPMKKRSELQLGAFVLCHVFDTRAAPDMEIEQYRHLRNRATHGGEFVSREEAVEYGQAAWSHIRAHLTSIRRYHPGAFREFVDTVKPTEDVNVSKHLPTLLFMAESYYGENWTLVEGLEFIESQRVHTYAP